MEYLCRYLNYQLNMVICIFWLFALPSTHRIEADKLRRLIGYHIACERGLKTLWLIFRGFFVTMELGISQWADSMRDEKHASFFFAGLYPLASKQIFFESEILCSNSFAKGCFYSPSKYKNDRNQNKLICFCVYADVSLYFIVWF